LPPDTEERLTNFTELVGTAIANVESREAVVRLADEQSALRRVAMLVARGVPPERLFVAVSDKVRRVLGTEVAAVGRFVPNVPAIDVIGLGIGREETWDRWELGDWMATAEVRRTGRSARSETRAWASAEGRAAETIRALGVVSIVASPIVVEDVLWGVILAGSLKEALPLDIEQRLEDSPNLLRQPLPMRRLDLSLPLRAGGSMPPLTRHAAASSATCTTVRSKDSYRSPLRFVPR
jgi:hypothetical protein